MNDDDNDEEDDDDAAGCHAACTMTKGERGVKETREEIAPEIDGRKM